MSLPSLLAGAALFASIVLLVFGTIAALRLEIEGFDPGVVGIDSALTLLGFVLGRLYGVRIVRLVGHIRAFAVFASVGAAVALVHPLQVSVASGLVLRPVLGFCIAGLMLVTESWVRVHQRPGDMQARGRTLPHRPRPVKAS